MTEIQLRHCIHLDKIADSDEKKLGKKLKHTRFLKNGENSKPKFWAFPDFKFFKQNLNT